MELSFFKEWDSYTTIKIGRELMNKIVKLDSIDSLTIKEEAFPVGSTDEGNTIARYQLDNISKLYLLKDLNKVLLEEIEKEKLKQKQEGNTLDIEPYDNISVLIKLITVVWSNEVTHFSIG